jgi:hypothetical protein
MGVVEGSEEVLRRVLVAAARSAGTLIRKEVLKRHALTADVNLPLAQGLLREVDSLLAMMPDFEAEMRKSMEEALREGKPILDSAVDRALKLFLASLPLAFTGSLSRMKNAVRGINSLVEVTNNIIRDLTKEGIYIPTLTPLEVERDDPVSLSSALRHGRDRLMTIIEFLQELKRYSEA